MLQVDNISDYCLILPKIKTNEMDSECGTYGDSRGVHRDLVGTPDGKRANGRARHRWKYNFKMDLEEVRWEGRLDCSGSG
jgi:hypothetical protein